MGRDPRKTRVVGSGGGKEGVKESPGGSGVSEGVGGSVIGELRKNSGERKGLHSAPSAPEGRAALEVSGAR